MFLFLVSVVLTAHYGSLANTFRNSATIDIQKSKEIIRYGGSLNHISIRNSVKVRESFQITTMNVVIEKMILTHETQSAISVYDKVS